MSWHINAGEISFINTLKGDYNNQHASQVDVFGNSASETICLDFTRGPQHVNMVKLNVEVFEKIAKELKARGVINV